MIAGFQIAAFLINFCYCNKRLVSLQIVLQKPSYCFRQMWPQYLPRRLLWYWCVVVDSCFIKSHYLVREILWIVVKHVFWQTRHPFYKNGSTYSNCNAKLKPLSRMISGKFFISSFQWFLKESYSLYPSNFRWL